MTTVSGISHTAGQVDMGITTPWNTGHTARTVSMTPEGAEKLAHALIVAAAKARKQEARRG